SYPRIVKLWHRGTPIASAKTIFEAQADDVSARPVVFRNPNATYALIERGLRCRLCLDFPRRHRVRARVSLRRNRKKLARHKARSAVRRLDRGGGNRRLGPRRALHL